MADYLLFATERYALPILQPLAEALHAAGHTAHAWFVDGAAGARLPAPVREAIRGSKGQPVTLRVLRAGRPIDLPVTPSQGTIPGQDE